MKVEHKSKVELYIKKEKDGVRVKGNLNPYWLLDIVKAVVNASGGLDKFYEEYEKVAEKEYRFFLTAYFENDELTIQFHPELKKEEYVPFVAAILIILQEGEERR